ncbi:MAG: hypothetical protein ACRDCF_01365, partial [Mycoplasmoidaceae bacterium]
NISSKLMTLGPDISPFGQIWTSDWLMYHHSESIWVCIQSSRSRTETFNGSNICYSMANLSTEGINCVETWVQNWWPLGPILVHLVKYGLLNNWHNMRKSQLVGIEISRSMTEKCPMGKIYATLCLMYHKKESIR